MRGVPSLGRPARGAGVRCLQAEAVRSRTRAARPSRARARATRFLQARIGEKRSTAVRC